MIDKDLFLDTNVFLGFATDFEEEHNRCKEIFDRELTRRTGTRVHSELNKIKSRRYKVIYNDLLNYLTLDIPIEKFSTSVSLSNNDKRHLKDILKQLENLDITSALNYLRYKIREIWDGVNYALTLIVKPFIRPYNYVECECAIDGCINNIFDSKILSDALCWARENQPLIFCTNDRKDFVTKKSRLYNILARVLACEIQEIPIQIMGLCEIITL